MTIRELRLEKGLTLDDFARSLGIGRSTLADYESGKRMPGEETLAAIMALYGVDLTDPATAAEDAEAEEAAEAELVGETIEEEAAEEELLEAEDSDEAVEEEAIGAEEAAAIEAEAIKADAAEEAVGAEPSEAEEAAAVEEEAIEADAAEEAVGAEPSKAEEAAVVEEEAIETEAAEEAVEAEEARIAAEEKAARKAAKKAAKKQKADEAAAQWVAEAIQALGDSLELIDEDAVAAARDAYDSLTYDQEQLIPGDLLSMLVNVEQMIDDASKTFPIADCWITVKDPTYTGKKVKAPKVTVERGDMKLKEGVDYTVRHDKKARNIGMYRLTVKGKGSFTGSVDVPFCVVPKISTLCKRMGGDKHADLAWKCLNNIEGLQIEYSRDKDFSDSKKVKIRKPRDLAKVAKKLKPGKKYHVRARLFATVKKKNYYSAWSKAKTVKT